LLRGDCFTSLGRAQFTTLQASRQTGISPAWPDGNQLAQASNRTNDYTRETCSLTNSFERISLPPMRDALVETAIDHFGQYGFEGAGTRAIAEASGTAMSSITYHFGGKQGLYLAAAEHIAQQIGALLGPALAQVLADAPAGPSDAAERLVQLLDRFAVLMLSPQTEKWSRFIIREQQQPTEAFDLLFETAMKPVVDAFLQLGAAARPDLAEREIRAMGILLWGQALILRAGRASVCRVMKVERLDEGTAALLRARLAENARSILAERPAGRETA
jgi:AcrR family transcriptional regulator